MPHLSGLSLTKMIPRNIKVVFTTAYSEYAVESYELEAVDYLLKPISLERFSKTVSKLLQSGPTSAPDHAVLFIKSGSRLYQLALEELLYLEKDGNYMTYHLADRKIVARESVAEALAELPDYFVQVHKSFLVSMRRINFVDLDEIGLGTVRIPLGKAFRDVFLEKWALADK
ncbi:MAG: response regulator transcription factor [Lewinellaceae bacterium]|nr:response regulator transcription factor [Lewinellaceae bacterium]